MSATNILQNLQFNHIGLSIASEIQIRQIQHLRYVRSCESLLKIFQNYNPSVNKSHKLKMLPFQKIITLIIRTMAKPMLTLAKKKHQQKKFAFMNKFFIGFGRKYSRIEHWINWKIVKSAKQSKMKELKEQVALQKGIEGIYEIFFYCIVIGLPLFEMHRNSVASQVKEEKLNKQIDGLERNLDEIASRLEQLLPRKIHVDIEPYIIQNQEAQDVAKSIESKPNQTSQKHTQAQPAEQKP